MVARALLTVICFNKEIITDNIMKLLYMFRVKLKYNKTSCYKKYNTTRRS